MSPPRRSAMVTGICVSSTAHDAQREEPVPRGMQGTPEIASPVESDNSGIDKRTDPTARPAPGFSSELSPVLELATKQAALAKSIGDIVKVGKSLSSTLEFPTEAMRKTLEGSQGFAKSLAAISKSYEDMWSPLQNSIQGIGYSIAKQVAAWDATCKSYLKQWDAAAQSFSETMREFGALVLRFKTTLMEFHWPPPTMDFDVTDMRYVVEAHDSFPPREAEVQINAFMLQRHDSDYVSGRLDDWKRHKWITSRIPILEAAVNAHIQGLYELSIPALLPQIEGIIWDGYGSRDGCHQPEEMRLAKSLLGDGLDFLNEVARVFFLNTLLHEFELGQPVPGLSRHAILHGIDTHYATVTNSLKLILLFDYFLSAFGVVSLGNSAIYHKLGCPHIQRSASRRTVYSSHQSAQRAGKKPCKSCHPEHL